MSLQKDLNWRYATKKFNNEKISDEKFQAIMDITALSASSYGLQPFRIIVVKNADVKAKLKEAAYGQAQLADSQAVFVFCGERTISKKYVDNYMERISATRGTPIEKLDGFRDTIFNTVDHLSQKDQQHWAAKQAYIALGTALAAAAEQGVDACPMEGFEREKFDEILGLEAKGLTSAVIMTLGHRSKEDTLADAAKVRIPVDELFIEVA